MDSSSSEEEDFEGFVVTPEEKLSYKAWTRKRRASEAFNDSSDDDLSGDDDNEDDDDDDDDDDEDDDDDQDEENGGLDNPLDEVIIEESGDEMSSGNTDQCPVCLMSLKDQLLGTPNNCTHVFCFDCIQEWAKNATTCPVGRKPFSEILVHASKKGPVLQRIPVEERQAEHDEQEDDPTYCEVCGECDREDRMLLCDGCDNGYHMDCLTPPAEFVPLDEWFCPSCSSYQEPEEQEGDSPRELTRARTTRGRPRGSTARRVSGSDRTGTTRTARTVASTRGRGRTLQGQGRGRGRSGSRGRGRGGRSSSTRGRRSSSKKKTRRRKKRRCGSTKETGSSSRKRSKKTSKRKTKKSTKKRRVAKEEEVSPFIYEPKRRGKTVHARLLESLSAPGPSTEPSRSTSSGRAPFPSRLEPSSSFSLFGNAFALHDFDEQEHDVQEETPRVEQAIAWSSESDNPDVLGSIFQGLHTLHSPSSQLSRDGKLVARDDPSRVERSPARNTENRRDSANNLRDKNQSEKEKEKPLVEKKEPKEEEIICKGTNNATVSSVDNPGGNRDCSLEKSVENRLKTADSASCGKPKETIHPPKTSSTSSSTPLKPVSPKPTLYAFRIPKRRSSLNSQNESKQVFSGVGVGSTSDKHDQLSVCSISKFKIPKRTNSCGDDISMNNFANAMVTNSDTACVGQKLGTSCKEQRVLFSNVTSPNKGLPSSTCGVTTTQSSSGFDRVRHVLHKNLERKNAPNLSTDRKSNTSYSSSLSRCHASKISIPHSYNSAPSTAINSGSVNVNRFQIQKSAPSRHAVNTVGCKLRSSSAGRETKSNNVTACHAKNFGDDPASNFFPPLTEEATFNDNSKPVRGKEQRRSNIEILKMLQEKQRNMREQMLDDPKAPLSLRRRSSDEVNSRTWSSERPHSSDEFAVCSRAVTLPVAVVKPSLHVSSPTKASSAVLQSIISDSSPVKSIASGIIDAHSSYSRSFQRVHSGIHPHSRDKLSKRGQDEKVPGTNGDRDQQRKLGIARLQRHQQIVDEVKLALKPFYIQGKITKDDYKLIMKKSVEKIEESNSSVDRDRVGRLVKKYVHKIKGVDIATLP